MIRVALFATCLGDEFFAQGCADAVRLLRHLDVEVTFPEAQTCCAQPAWNAGYEEEARRVARHTLEVFSDAEYVVLPSGSCTAMLRSGYADLFSEEPDLLASARSLAARTWELAGFVHDLLGVEELGRGIAGRRVAYHHGCHALREPGLSGPPVRLLEGAGAQVVPWEADSECCGFGGLFAVKFPEVSGGMADRKTSTLPSEAEVLTSADGGCLLQLAGRLRREGRELQVRPLASLLWEACGG